MGIPYLLRFKIAIQQKSVKKALFRKPLMSSYLTQYMSFVLTLNDFWIQISNPCLSTTMSNLQYRWVWLKYSYSCWDRFYDIYWMSVTPEHFSGCGVSYLLIKQICMYLPIQFRHTRIRTMKLFNLNVHLRLWTKLRKISPTCKAPQGLFIVRTGGRGCKRKSTNFINSQNLS